jgi:hypothetical protein
LCPFSEDLHENWGPPPGELNTDGQDLLIYGALAKQMALQSWEMVISWDFIGIYW